MAKRLLYEHQEGMKMTRIPKWKKVKVAIVLGMLGMIVMGSVTGQKNSKDLVARLEKPNPLLKQVSYFEKDKILNRLRFRRV